MDKIPLSLLHLYFPEESLPGAVVATGLPEHAPHVPDQPCLGSIRGVSLSPELCDLCQECSVLNLVCGLKSSAYQTVSSRKQSDGRKQTFLSFGDDERVYLLME